MILVCPSCDTRYKVDDTSLGEAGRQVKCARCGNVWHAEPEAAPPPPIEAEPSGEVYSGTGESWTDPEPAGDPDARTPPPAPAEDLTVKRPPPLPTATGGARSMKPGGAGWALLGLTVAGVLLAGYAARDQVIAAWPPAAKLYDVLGVEHGGIQVMSDIAGGGLVLEGVESSWDRSEDKVVLTVRGTVANHSNIERPVPPLVVWLAAEDDRKLHSWSLTVDATVLAPGESVAFETSIDNPADDAKRVEIAVLDS